MSDLKAGDRVEFNQQFGTRAVGHKGTVNSVQEGLYPTVVLEMDEENYLGSRFAQPYVYKVTKIEIPVKPQAAKEIPTDLITMVKSTSERVGTRNVDAIFKSLAEEVGELATELSIEAGTKKRQPSPDGVVGEAIDVLVVILDLLHLKLGNDITGQAFLDRVQSKLNKWEGKA